MSDVLENNAIDKYVGNRLRQQRLYACISQTEVANHLNVSFQQIQKYEKGRNRISASTLYQLAKFLNVEVSYFFDGLAETKEPEEHLEPSRIDYILAGKIQAISNPEFKRNIVQLVKSFAG